MDKPALKVDWATHAAAKFACENWHYSKSTPVGGLVKIGAWEGPRFIGVVIFAWGMNKSLGAPYGLAINECCELVRVALSSHQWEVSKVVSLALKFLHKKAPGIRLVVSFADPVAGHHGGIYQAGNWIYSGKSASSFEWRVNGDRLNKRAYTGHNFGAPKMALPAGAQRVTTPGKHRYLMPLDAEMRKQIMPLAKPYPKRAGSDTKDMPGSQPGEGGSTPTPALHYPALVVNG